jgi:hypothetical protein
MFFLEAVVVELYQKGRAHSAIYNFHPPPPPKKPQTCCKILEVTIIALSCGTACHHIAKMYFVYTSVICSDLRLM